MRACAAGDIYDRRVKSGEYQRVDEGTLKLCIEAYKKNDHKAIKEAKKTYIKNTGISIANFWYAFSAANYKYNNKGA